MVDFVLSGIENAMFGVFGNYIFLGLAVVLFFFVLLVWRGLDFRYALMILSPCVLRLAEGSWLPSWVGFMMWFFVVGFGLYLGWRVIAPTY